MAEVNKVYCPYCNGEVSVREDCAEELAVLQGFLIWALKHPIEEEEEEEKPL